MASLRESKLDEAAKHYAVQQQACFVPPSTVREAIKKDFGAEISVQAIEAYDPTKHAGRKLSDKWRLLFEETRKAFLENTAEIGASHRSVRLATLNRMALKAESLGNMKLAADLLKQAAEEMGGAYTNRREITGAGGAPLPVTPAVTIFALPDNGRG